MKSKKLRDRKRTFVRASINGNFASNAQPLYREVKKGNITIEKEIYNHSDKNLWTKKGISS